MYCFSDKTLIDNCWACESFKNTKRQREWNTNSFHQRPKSTSWLHIRYMWHMWYVCHECKTDAHLILQQLIHSINNWNWWIIDRISKKSIHFINHIEFMCVTIDVYIQWILFMNVYLNFWGSILRIEQPNTAKMCWRMKSMSSYFQQYVNFFMEMNLLILRIDY